jgi:protein TonB
VQGKVIIQFVIDKDGKVTNIKVLRGPSQTLINEAIRVMKLCPAWNPGFQFGLPANLLFTLPISFNLHDQPVDPFYYDHLKYQNGFPVEPGSRHW